MKQNYRHQADTSGTVKSQYNVFQFTVVFSFAYDFEIPRSVSHIINVKISHFYVVHYCVFFSITYRSLDIIVIKLVKYRINEN
jgi:hypothetical protein